MPSLSGPINPPLWPSAAPASPLASPGPPLPWAQTSACASQKSPLHINSRRHPPRIGARPKTPPGSSVCAPGIQQFPVQIIFRELVRHPIGDPQMMVGGHENMVSRADVRQLLEELAILIEYLYPSVGPVRYVHAPCVWIGGDRVRRPPCRRPTVARPNPRIN